MSITYHIDQRARIIRTKCSGNVTLAEVLEHFRVLEQDISRPDRLHVLLNLSETTSLPDAGQIRTVGQVIGALQEKVNFGVCAIAVPNEALYGMARMFEVLAEQNFYAVKVFRDVPAAEEWLVQQLHSAPERT